MAQPVTLNITLDLDAYMRGRTIYNEDGESVDSGQTTLEEVVLDMVAGMVFRDLTAKASRGDGWRDSIRERVNDIRDGLITEALQPVVTEALTTPVQKTNSYGESTCDPTTLRDEIMAVAKAWLNTPDRDNYSRTKGLTRKQALIAAEVDKALTVELKTSIDQAKAEVIGAVQAKGAEVLAKTIAQMAAR